MMNNYDVYIHVGIAKAASSTLQNLTKNEKKINFLGLLRDHSVSSKKRLPNKNQTFFLYVKGATKNFKQACEIRNDLVVDKINFISDEDMTMSHTSSYKNKLKRLKKIFPEAKIVLFIRHPVDTLISWHNFHIRGGVVNENLKIENYINSVDSLYARECIKILEKINFIKKTFGTKSLHVINFEKIITFSGQNELLKNLFKIQNPYNKKKVVKNSSFTLLNQVYLKFPILYKIKFYLPLSLIKLLKKILGILILSPLEKKLKNKVNKNRKKFLETKFKKEIAEYLVLSNK